MSGMKCGMDPYTGSKRQGILSRPVRKTPSRMYETTDEVQYRAEIEALERKKEVYRQREYERIKSVFGTRADQIEMQKKVKEEMDAIMAEREIAKRSWELEEKEIEQRMLAQLEFKNMEEAEQAEARKQFERYIYEQNQQFALAHQEEKINQRQREILEDREREDFFENAFIKTY